MRMACFWVVTAGLLLPFCRAYGQWQGADQDGTVVNAPTVCNDGTISVSVARAFFDGEWVFRGDLWEVRGWDSVAPGKCQAIGEVRRYFSGNLLNRTHSVTLLAFAFEDSAGTWGAVHVSDTTDGIFKPSNEHLCVSHDAFSNWHPVSHGGPGSDCAKPGYFLIPASLEYTADTHYGYYGGQMAYSNPKDFLHVRVDSSSRAISLGPQSSSHAPSTADAVGSAATEGDSFGDQVRKALAKAVVEAGTKPAPKFDQAASDAQSRAAWLKAVREDVTDYIAASATGFDAYKKGDSTPVSGNRVWESKVKPQLARGCWVIQGDATATFSCLLFTDSDLNKLHSFYTNLTDDIGVSLPADWKADAVPPFGGDLPSKSFQASSGAHGEIWIGRADSGNGYELHYQVVSAAIAVTTPAAPVDDPVGDGGFIRPPSKP